MCDSTSFGTLHERSLQRSFCLTLQDQPWAGRAKHNPVPSMMHAPGIALATSVTCLHIQECHPRQGGQRMHILHGRPPAATISTSSHFCGWLVHTGVPSQAGQAAHA